jgi:hypothetical protein
MHNFPIFLIYCYHTNTEPAVHNLRYLSLLNILDERNLSYRLHAKDFPFCSSLMPVHGRAHISLVRISSHGGPIDAPFPSLHSHGCYRKELVPLMVSMVTHDGSNFRAPLGKPATSADQLVAQVFLKANVELGLAYCDASKEYDFHWACKRVGNLR